MLVSDLYCPSCRNAKDHKPQDNEVCWSCVAMGGAGNYKESKTNYDLLIRKTPEELAEFMADTGQGCPPGEDLSECCFGKPEPPSKKTCAKCWLDWLKQEASE